MGIMVGLSQSGNVHIEIHGRWCEIFMRAKYESKWECPH
jgi:hypothetical protein